MTKHFFLQKSSGPWKYAVHLPAPTSTFVFKCEAYVQFMWVPLNNLSMLSSGWLVCDSLSWYTWAFSGHLSFNRKVEIIYQSSRDCSQSFKSSSYHFSNYLLSFCAFCAFCPLLSFWGTLFLNTVFGFLMKVFINHFLPFFSSSSLCYKAQPLTGSSSIPAEILTVVCHLLEGESANSKGFKINK